MKSLWWKNFFQNNCKRLEPASITNGRPIIGRSKNEFVIIDTTPSPAPSANEPVSPIIKRAGGTLNQM